MENYVEPNTLNTPNNRSNKYNNKILDINIFAGNINISIQYYTYPLTQLYSTSPTGHTRHTLHDCIRMGHHYIGGLSCSCKTGRIYGQVRLGKTNNNFSLAVGYNKFPWSCPSLETTRGICQ